MRYLITGATGFVGAAVARRVLEEGDEAHLFVRDRSRAQSLEEAGATVFEGTVGDPNAVARAARGCEVVVHAAAIPTHRAAERALRWINVAGTENVLNAARHAGVARVVHISCADVTLVNEDRVHWNEDRHVMKRPLDAHARTKQLAEELALAASTGGLEVTAIRPAWLWGPGDRTHLPAFCREGLRGGFRLVGSGENLLASTYVDNLVDAILSAAEVTEAPGQAYYVTDGELQHAWEFFGALSQALGLPPPRSGPPLPFAHALAWTRQRTGADGLWPTEVIRRGRSSHFDQQRAMTDLDWEPRVTVAEGMDAVRRWALEVGGPDAIASLHRPAPDASAVDAEVAAADAFGAPSSS